MDKMLTAWYTQGMRKFAIATVILLCLCKSGVAEAQAADSLSQWDVESMYVQAKAMLEDRSIQDVSSVPMLLETCAREGHTEATRLLLDVYEGRFKGLSPNPQQALKIAHELAEAERLDKRPQEYRKLRTEAMFRLALYLEKGIAGAADKAAAYAWMRRAAQRGMPEAVVEKARYLMNGTGTPQRPEKAWRLLYKQAKEAPATPHLFFYMGHMCLQGKGIPRDARKAFELFRMGARLNDAQCLNNLGTMFENGYPTPRDYESAYQLYRKAAYLGNKEASANMQRLAFKEEIRASSRNGTPYRKRIDHATSRIINALPVSPETQEQLTMWLTSSTEQENL